MTEIRFYHLQNQALEQALPALLSKALQTGRRAVVKTAAPAQAERLSEHLWTYRPDSFLPHGTKSDGHGELQPVWLTAEDENPNGADVLILTQGSESAAQENFSLCCEIFDGNDPESVRAARARWKDYKEKGFTVTYWQQTPQGGWEDKA